MKTINGVQFDPQPIADGLYAIICERGEEAIVAFGMLPKWIMDMCERLVREKVIAISASQIGCSPEELKASGFLSGEKVGAIVRPIMKEVATCIYGAAKREGKMVV